MPSLDQVLEFRKRMYEESSDIIRKKGHDYNRRQQLGGDTLFNLKVAAIMGIVETPEQGILVRLMDKMMRLASLMTADVEAAVKDESVRDTVKDVHNYVDYALQLWEERKAESRQVRGSEVEAPLSFKEARDDKDRPLGFVVEQRMKREPQAG